MACSSVGGSMTAAHWPLAPFMFAMLTVPANSFPLCVTFRTTNSAPSAQVPFQVPTNGFRDALLPDCCATCNGGWRRRAVMPRNNETFVGRGFLVMILVGHLGHFLVPGPSGHWMKPCGVRLRAVPLPRAMLGVVDSPRARMSVTKLRQPSTEPQSTACC
jgi:hypothetical protein